SQADRYATARDMALALRHVSARFPVSPALSMAPAGPRARGVPPSPSVQQRFSAGGAAEGELRQVTIVSCALSGYDELVSSLDPAELEERIRWMRSAIADVAVAHGGTLHHFSGDEIVLLFGI